MSYDVVVIGAGPGGYVGAIKAAQCGLKTAIIEKRAELGGTCLNVGCIPSKALLHGSEHFAHVSHGLEDLGIEIAGEVRLNLEKLMAHKDKTVEANTAGIRFLMKKNKIDVYHSVGKIIDKNHIAILDDKGNEQKLETKNILIATGSEAAGIPGLDVKIDEEVIVSSTGALSLKKVPGKMIVIGAGVIGCELGSVWSRLGAEVTIIEYADKPLGATDKEISEQFKRLTQKQGLNYRLGMKVTNVVKQSKGVKVQFVPTSGGAEESLEADIVLIATGRRPYTEGLGLENVGISLDKMGRIEINDHWQTSCANIYAIGDVVKGPMLAHKAEEEAVAVAEILAGQRGHVNYDVIPSVIYTHPEVASVGKTEEELKAAGIAYNVGKFPFAANGRARAMLESDGFVKILTDKKTDKVLGGHILGYNAGEMIHEIAVLMEFGGAAEDLARTTHAHPTLSEAVKEAAMNCYSKALHI